MYKKTDNRNVLSVFSYDGGAEVTLYARIPLNILYNPNSTYIPQFFY